MTKKKNILVLSLVISNIVILCYSYCKGYEIGYFDGKQYAYNNEIVFEISKIQEQKKLDKLNKLDKIKEVVINIP